ncbi:hypothetical protein, partial [Bacillus sp. AFS051223]|uniref:hypothetical protein n=1 Tax=Bacillus sp. AFS051223 TaxID=2034280 RepID=UPI0015D4B337
MFKTPPSYRDAERLCTYEPVAEAKLKAGFTELAYCIVYMIRMLLLAVPAGVSDQADMAVPGVGVPVVTPVRLCVQLPSVPAFASAVL